MNISQLKESRFLKKEDVEPELVVTVAAISQENVASEGQPEEKKWCIHFDETDKPLVLNSTNGQLIATALGSEESDDWKGKKITLFHDRSVSFGGKLTGGIRVRV